MEDDGKGGGLVQNAVLPRLRDPRDAERGAGCRREQARTGHGIRVDLLKEDFEPEKYKDDYREALKTIIDAKLGNCRSRRRRSRGRRRSPIWWRR